MPLWERNEALPGPSPRLNPCSKTLTLRGEPSQTCHLHDIRGERPFVAKGRGQRSRETPSWGRAVKTPWTPTTRDTFCRQTAGDPPRKTSQNDKAVWGARVAQPVERLTSAQVMIVQFVSSSPASGSVLTNSSEPEACFRLCVSLSLPLPSSCSVSVSQKGINVKKIFFP